MKSSRRPNTLKHLPFFEVLANAPEGSGEAKLATAGLLTLRMIDHWVLAGPPIVEPESVSVRSVRAAIMQLAAREPAREALLTIVNTMQMLRQVDLVPVLPRAFAYAQLLERHYGALPLASDAYESVIRLADEEFDAELVMDAMHRLAYCQRKLGQLDAATASSQTMAKLATRRKDRARQLRAKIGLGQVAMLRGNLAAADSQLHEVQEAAQRHELTRELAMAIHNRAVVASNAGRSVDAVLLAHQSLKVTSDPVERDRVLGDLAAFLIQLEQYEAAIDALRIIEMTSASEEPRRMAKANLLIAAVRAGNVELFEAMREELDGVALSADAHVNVLIETARGLRLFGRASEAESVLDRAEADAVSHGFSVPLAEIQRLRSQPVESGTARRIGSHELETQTVTIDLRRMAKALVTVS